MIIMTDQFKSQLLGISLALATAIGCIAYEKLVKSYSFSVILASKIIFAVVMMVGILFMSGTGETMSDFSRLLQDKKAIMWFVVFLLMEVTAIFWFYITKKQSVMVGSIYELKYIIILALIYIFLGDAKFTTNTVIGIALALSSVYFISK